MSNIPKEVLAAEVKEILKAANVCEITTREVCAVIEKKLNCSLDIFEVDKIVMDYVNTMSYLETEDNDGDSMDSEAERYVNENTVKKAKKRSGSMQAKVLEAKKINFSILTDFESNDDANKEASKKIRVTVLRQKITSYTRTYILSPELSEIVGIQSLPEYEWAGKISAIIKERALYDPENKQDVDVEIKKIKRFSAFDKLKYREPHFLN